MIHAVKSYPEYYAAALKGRKPFEVRSNDRDYKVGDFLAINEYNPDSKEYTGKCFLVVIMYILNDPQYCKPGFAVLGIRRCKIEASDEFCPRFEYGSDICNGIWK